MPCCVWVMAGLAGPPDYRNIVKLVEGWGQAMKRKGIQLCLSVLATTAMFVLAVAFAPARAQDCPTGVSSTWCSRWESGQCLQWSATCNSTNSSTVSHYGAIAYGPKTGAFGYSYSWNTQAQAQNTAMKNCAQHGNDCEVAVWFRQECGAVVSDAGTAYYWGLGNTAAIAASEAKKSCAKQGGKICHEEVSQCSG